MKTVGIYVHLPFCVRKCYYCDFVSFAGYRAADREAYLRNLRREIGLYRDLYGPIKGKSLYLGGGTPTSLSVKQLGQLFTLLHDSFLLPPDIEITVEANPGTLGENKLRVLKDFGCNRLSVGVQSFKRHDLQVLGRLYTPADVFKTLQKARQVGFRNISLDLMYGLPGQSLSAWRDNLKKAVELAPEHLSLYQLKIEEGTPLAKLAARGIWEEFSQDKASLFYQEACRYLSLRGYVHYEISNFALPARESLHNTLYWLNKEYLGLGVGAAGYLAGVRYVNTADLPVYAALLMEEKLPRVTEELIGLELAARETMFLGFRLLKGIAKEEFCRRHGVTLEEKYGPILRKLMGQGLLQETETSVALTQKGLLLANMVFREFL